MHQCRPAKGDVVSGAVDGNPKKQPPYVAYARFLVTMLLGCLYLLIEGAGLWSMDAAWSRRLDATQPASTPGSYASRRTQNRPLWDGPPLLTAA